MKFVNELVEGKEEFLEGIRITTMWFGKMKVKDYIKLRVENVEK